ncbi:MAG: hypothetical protein PVG03_01820 [Desulfarculaceae bacterium]|jgi:hypothetical protein
METETKNLVLVDKSERKPLHFGASTLFYRRLSLGALASLEKTHTVYQPRPGGGPPLAVVPAAALEAALVAHVLVDWEGVAGREGKEEAFSPEAARRLPAEVRRLLLKEAQKL